MLGVAIVCLLNLPMNVEGLGARERPIPAGIVDKFNLFPNVGAMLVVVVPNDFGIPEGILAFCSGTLIHERVFLTAGHCTGPSSFAPLPPFIQVFVTLAPTLLAEPVRGIRPAALGSPDVLESPAATRRPMLFVGYGFRELSPEGEILAVSEWDGWRRIHASRMERVVDDTWAWWTLPSQVCFGDSGGPRFLQKDPLGGPFDLALVAVASDGGIDCLSRDDRARVDTSADQQWITGRIQDFLSRE